MTDRFAVAGETGVADVDAVAVSFPRGTDPDEIRTTMRELAPA